MADFKNNRLDKVFAQQKNGLVYNDAHFDNFIYADGNVKLIDFDRTIYCSIDYELMVIKMMQDNPKKFASEITEKYVLMKILKIYWNYSKNIILKCSILNI